MDSLEIIKSNIRKNYDSNVKFITDNKFLKDAIINYYQCSINELTNSEDISPQNKRKILQPFRDELRMFITYLSFNEASYFDNHYFTMNDEPLFWCKAFNDPIEGDIIIMDGYKYRVTEVGLLTFIMKPLYYCYIKS